jgi:predicted type IV restriction endonuclease
MTREEAIARLKVLTDYEYDEDLEALEIAIKALEQEPCKREIEREYLFQSLCEDFKKLQAENDDLRKRLEQEPCEDAISRQYLLDNCVVDKVTMPYVPISKIQEAPPANQQEPKTGHWIADVDKWGDVVTTINGYKCSECGEFNADKDNYCPNCGARMAESEES